MPHWRACSWNEVRWITTVGRERPAARTRWSSPATQVSSHNFEATLLGVDEYRRFLTATNPPASSFALVRRRAPGAPTGWAWDLYTERPSPRDDHQIHAGNYLVRRSGPPALAASPASACTADARRSPDRGPLRVTALSFEHVSAGRLEQVPSGRLDTMDGKGPGPLADPGALAARQDTQSVPRCQDSFAGWAQQYEHDALSRLLTRLQLRAAARLGLTASDRFLDVGCATGAAVRDASAAVSLAVGVDRSAAMVRRAQLLAAGLPGTVFVVADAEQLPFPAATFTAVLSTSTLRHFGDPMRAACELARVVRPGGRIVVADFVACGDGGGRRRWSGARRPGRVPRWVGPLQVVSAVPVLVAEVVRCSTAFGYYVIVLAAKPRISCPRGSFMLDRGWWSLGPRR